jgi:hypothetical protein
MDQIMRFAFPLLMGLKVYQSGLGIGIIPSDYVNIH